MRLFLEDGYERTSVDRIVAAAGVAKGTFFRHYATKAAVLEEWIRTWFTEVVQEATVEATAPLLDNVLSLARAMGRSSRSYLRLTGWLIVESYTAMLRSLTSHAVETQPGGIAPKAVAGHHEPGLLAAYVAELIRAASPRTSNDGSTPVAGSGYIDPDAAAEALSNAWFGTILFCLEHPERNPEVELTQAARIWYDGVGGTLKASEQVTGGEE